MSAFWSGTDDANENMNQFYGVYGKIFDEQPQFLFRFCSGDFKINYDPSVLFDFPTVKVTTQVTKEFSIEGMEPVTETKVEEQLFKGPWPMVEYPEDWMEQHSRSYTYPAYGGYSGYGGGAYRYGSGYSYGKGNTGAGTTPTQASIWDYYDDYDYGYGGQTTAGTYSAGEKKTSGTGAKSQKKEEETMTLQYGDTEVDVFVEKIVNEWTLSQIKQLMKDLCDFGYDYILRDVIKESEYYYGRYDY